MIPPSANLATAESYFRRPEYTLYELNVNSVITSPGTRCYRGLSKKKKKTSICCYTHAAKDPANGWKFRMWPSRTQCGDSRTRAEGGAWYAWRSPSTRARTGKSVSSAILKESLATAASTGPGATGRCEPAGIVAIAAHPKTVAQPQSQPAASARQGGVSVTAKQSSSVRSLSCRLDVLASSRWKYGVS